MRNYIIGMSIVLGCFSGTAYAQASAEKAECFTIVRECLTQGAGDQNCFYAAATNPACKNKKLGDLSFQRWAVSPSSVTSPDSLEIQAEDLALVGPKFIDQQCLTNFDNQLSSELIKGNPSNETVESLIKRLGSCRRDAAMQDVFRP